MKAQGVGLYYKRLFINSDLHEDIGYISSTSICPYRGIETNKDTCASKLLRSVPLGTVNSLWKGGWVRKLKGGTGNN